MEENYEDNALQWPLVFLDRAKLFGFAVLPTHTVCLGGGDPYHTTDQHTAAYTHRNAYPAAYADRNACAYGHRYPHPHPLAHSTTIAD